MPKIKGVVYRKLLRRNAVGLVEDGDDTIYIDPRLKGRKKMEILIHEALHILFPKMTEKAVIENSVELTKMLWAEGYRQADHDDSEPFQG